jgi:hypothetical protein
VVSSSSPPRCVRLGGARASTRPVHRSDTSSRTEPAAAAGAGPHRDQTAQFLWDLLFYEHHHRRTGGSAQAQRRLLVITAATTLALTAVACAQVMAR